MPRTYAPSLTLAISLALLSACGGGTSGGLVSTPASPPAPNPTPTPKPTASPTPAAASAPVVIFANPTPVEYTSTGGSISGPGGNLDTYAKPDERFGLVSSSASDQVHIRYNGAGFYEVQMPGAAWDRLVPYRAIQNPTAENNYFQPELASLNAAYVTTLQTPRSGYSYTELASWGSSAASRWGWAAFGSVTPAQSVPQTGTASYAGTVHGSSDILLADNLYGGYYPLPIDGQVTLQFDFSRGDLTGAMQLFLPDGMQPASIGTFAFKDASLAKNSGLYSGRFDTAVAGQNFFSGQLMGPNAEELGGSWALPFKVPTGVHTFTNDGQVHQAFGAWAARR